MLSFDDLWQSWLGFFVMAFCVAGDMIAWGGRINYLFWRADDRPIRLSRLRWWQLKSSGIILVALAIYLHNFLEGPPFGSRLMSRVAWLTLGAGYLFRYWELRA